MADTLLERLARARARNLRRDTGERLFAAREARELSCEPWLRQPAWIARSWRRPRRAKRPSRRMPSPQLARCSGSSRRCTSSKPSVARTFAVRSGSLQGGMPGIGPGRRRWTRERAGTPADCITAVGRRQGQRHPPPRGSAPRNLGRSLRSGENPNRRAGRGPAGSKPQKFRSTVLGRGESLGRPIWMFAKEGGGSGPRGRDEAPTEPNGTLECGTLGRGTLWWSGAGFGWCWPVRSSRCQFPPAPRFGRVRNRLTRDDVGGPSAGSRGAQCPGASGPQIRDPAVVCLDSEQGTGPKGSGVATDVRSAATILRHGP
jgi:hypothetical protein